ncbi:MAG TPA: MarR family transcriptional regulator [Xanthobacteraceae bacterium]|nr:MarR family transcriptional regulator [Xanthobacteraceae bacterium]
MREDDPGLQAWSHFLGAHALALRAVEARLKAAGQPPLAWYDVLLELERADGRLRIGELGDRLVVEPYNMTRLVDRLEKEKLLRREPAEDDARVAVVTITDKGKELRRSIWPHYRRAIREVFADAITDADADAMVRAMKKVIAHLREAQTAAS